MKTYRLALVLALALVLCGCGRETAAETNRKDPVLLSAQESLPTEEPTVPATVPADGNPGDVTCQGSYTGQVNGTVVAQIGEKGLTNEVLQAWYWAEVAQYRQENHPEAPDFSRPLDQQACTIDSSVHSWQQYFLDKALTSWHKAQALICASEEVPLPTEEAYQPNMENHEKYMTGMPVVKYLYGYNTYYVPNTMHQAYLDSLPETLDTLAREKGYDSASQMAAVAFCADETALTVYGQDVNLAYMYFTHMSHYIEPAAEELDAYVQENQAGFAREGRTVDIRQILLVPDDVVKNGWVPEGQEPEVLERVEVREDGTVSCSEEAWSICEKEAQSLLKSWKSNPQGRKATESTFAELAHEHSDDSGTSLDGGAYYGVTQGRMLEEVDEWCFDPARQAGDTTIVRSDYGIHILYIIRSVDSSADLAEEDYYRQQQKAILENACAAYPMEVNYSAIALGTAEGTVAASEILYPDIAHERFPEVPLYLQQDYPTTMYGTFKITSNGCGITSLAMLASYMADDELTPPEMCARYGSYSHRSGTDGMIFNYEPAVMDFYLRKKTYDQNEAWEALLEGQIVISVQQKGYWTRGGHYIVIEDATEDGLIQVRDSNIFNFGRLKAHVEDWHTWQSVISHSGGYWIYEDKVTNIPACSRCGTGENGYLLEGDYTCHKCTTALLRRNTYLAG